MKIGYLAYKNLVSKPFNLLLSLMLLVLSVSLVTFVLQLSKQVGGQLSKNITPFDMVVGAKGSPLQLVLSSVLHIDAPTGNIKLKEAKQVQNNPLVKFAIPLSYGDNYKGVRILGTTTDYIDKYGAILEEGRLFEKSFEVVIGSNVSKRLELKIGDSFSGSHGLLESAFDVHDEHPFTVKGILKSTGTVVDQLIITNLESVWETHDHGSHDNETPVNNHNDEHDHDDDAHDHGDDKKEHGGHDHDEEIHDHGDHEKEHGGHDHDDHDHDHVDHEKEHNEHDRDDDAHSHEDHDHDSMEKNGKIDLNNYSDNKEITSLLVKFRSPIGMIQFPRYINENTNMQSALPSYEIQRLTNLFGSGIKMINGIAFAILLVSGLSIFISLLKTIRERKNELALLRTYGVRSSQLLVLALLEGLFLAGLGYVLGWIFGRIGIWGVSSYMQKSYGYALEINGPEIFELFLLGMVIVIAIVATLLASLSIFKLNVAKTLSDG
ncbi:putative ABC transport system permease protein [Tenacibaculum sp. MAR_2009_124]|uniref:ABC transporter permease n=1 Tax=Tenacibaculum sp. MAR_2009_124 TaxID=1250059 RepID=UPI00089D04C0|nr:ABC transporter permease [Tenacibaculum sp. MAR_2009_124]SEB35789.1 putative ABC transport system permease protein [Tenacibaculum sp. MAR_2009_124]